MNLYLTKSKTLIIGGLVILFVILLALNVISSRKTPVEQPRPVQYFDVNSLQKAEAGKTTEQQVETLPNITGKTTQADGSIKYSISSFVPQYPDEIIIKDGKVIFEKINTPTEPKVAGYSKISQLTSHYGQPEAIVQGSASFGPFVSYYIYASKGIAFIGNPTTDEVYQIHTFLPTSVEDYKLKFGSDIKEGLPEPEAN